MDMSKVPKKSKPIAQESVEQERRTKTDLIQRYTYGRRHDDPNCRRTEEDAEKAFKHQRRDGDALQFTGQKSIHYGVMAGLITLMLLNGLLVLIFG